MFRLDRWVRGNPQQQQKQQQLSVKMLTAQKEIPEQQSVK